MKCKKKVFKHFVWAGICPSHIRLSLRGVLGGVVAVEAERYAVRGNDVPAIQYSRIFIPRDT